MDTDDFSDESYAIIVQAARVSDTLKAELGAMNSRYSNEEDWLHGAVKHLRGIQTHPHDYVDLWSLDEFEGVTPAQIRELATRLLDQIPEILAMPLVQRGIESRKAPSTLCTSARHAISRFLAPGICNP